MPSPNNKRPADAVSRLHDNRPAIVSSAIITYIRCIVFKLYDDETGWHSRNDLVFIFL